MESITSPPMSHTKFGSFFSPLYISLIGIVISSLAILFYHFFLVKYCMRRNQTNADSSAQPPTVARPPSGVEKHVLITIPIFPFSMLKHGDLSKECVVCLGEFLDQDTVRFLPNCKHVFHLPCIDEWFEAHDSCPLCRSPIFAQKMDAQDIVISWLASNERTSSTGDSDEESNVCNTSDQTSNVRPHNGLQRQLSLALPRPSDERASHLATGLKRSLSMDQKNFVEINLQRESLNLENTSTSDSTSELVRSQSYATRSLNHLDRMSSRLLKSFLRLRLGKESSVTILPY